MSDETVKEETTKSPKPQEPIKDDTQNAKLEAELAKLKQQLKDAKDAEVAVRGNSDKLLNEKKAADAKLKALGNYDDVLEILTAVKTVEEAKQIEAGDVEQVYEARLGKFKADIHDPIVEELADLKIELASLKSQLADNNKRPLVEAGWKAAKGKHDKLKYHYKEAAQVFNFEDGQFIPRGKDGNIIYGKGGTDPITVEQFFNGVLSDEPDHKIPSVGTTATGGGDGKLNVTVNPWSKTYAGGDKYSLRSQIKREAPQKARELQRAAGYVSRK